MSRQDAKSAKYFSASDTRCSGKWALVKKNFLATLASWRLNPIF
jgi:hypothetical protein